MAPQGTRRLHAITDAAIGALILSILGLILAPVVQRARSASPMTQCASHLHEIGAAFQVYVDDWDDSYPLNRYCKADSPCDPRRGGLEGSFYNWKRALMAAGAVKRVSVYQCPSNGHSWITSEMNACLGDESNCVGSNKGVKDLQIPISYGYNAAFFHEAYGTRFSNDIERPTSLLLVVESSAGYPDVADWSMNSMFIHPNHRANWLFADGKVRALKVSETISQTYFWRNPSDTQRSMTVNGLDRRLR